MKKCLSILTTTFLLALAACTGSTKETIRETVVQKNADYPTPPPVEGANNMGPSDGGGGAGKNGKPLESYQVVIQDRPEFKQHIAPILEQLSKSFPHLAADLDYISSERTWYLIPGPLKKLSGTIMGLGSFVDFDQLAFQNLNEVWIDSTHYQGEMNDSDQARLLLHEMVMGVRLLEFADSLDQCLAEARMLLSDPKTKDQYSESKKDCYSRYPRLSPIRKKLELDEDDYSVIRALVKELIQKKGDVDASEMKSWLSANGFRNYN